MITLTDRKSRFLLGKNISRKVVAEARKGMIAMLITLPAEKRRSITPDRVKKFLNHEHITAVIWMVFHFNCQTPYASWEK